MSYLNIKSRLFAAAFILFAVSCSKESSDTLTNYISSDVSVANVVNVDELFRKAGVPFGGATELNEAQTKLLALATQSMLNDELTALIESGGIDYDEILLLSLKDRSNILGVSISDKDAVDKAMREGGFDTHCVTKGNLCFVANNRSTIENFIKSVDQDAPEFLSEVKMSLEVDKTIRSVLHLDVNGINWLTMNVNVAAEAIAMEWGALDGQGRKVEFGEIFGEIDPAVLGFIPNDAVLVLAFGKPDFENQLLNRLKSQYGWFVDQIVGTTAMSVSLGGSVDNLRMAGPEAFNIQFATTANETNTQSLLNLCGQYFDGSKSHDDRYLSNLYGCDLWYGIKNGFLSVAYNRPFSSDNSNDFASRFEGKRFACDCEIPYGSSLMNSLNLNTGVSLNMSLTDDKFKMRLRFNGSSKTAALTLIDLSSDFVSFVSLAPALLF